MATKKIVDISYYNTIEDWSALAKAVDGLILRLGYRGYGEAGTLKKDDKVDEFISKCEKYKIPFGFYFFTQAKTEAEAKEEADFSKNIIGKHKPILPVYFDTEGSTEPNGKGRADGLNKAARTKTCIAFCEQIKKHGFIPGVYTGEWWAKDKIDISKLRNYSLWIAKYSTSKPNIDNYDGWQYTEKGKVNGVKGVCDVSKFTKDFTAKPKPTKIEQKPKPKPKPKPKQEHKKTETKKTVDFKKLYTIGKTYKLKDNLKVRKGPGKNYRQKTRKELTADARKHSLDQVMAVLKKDTKVTISNIIIYKDQVWVQIPSGWIAAYYNKSNNLE